MPDRVERVGKLLAVVVGRLPIIMERKALVSDDEAIIQQEKLF